MLTSSPTCPRHASPSDDALLLRVRDGDDDAFGLLYERWAPNLLRVASRVMASRADAEDVVHDVFVALPHALQRFTPEGRAGAWLIQCTTRASLMKLRGVRRRRETPMPATELVAAAAADDRARLIDLDRRLAALPVSLRTVLVLHRLEGLSHAEIASTLGITEGSSRVRLTRALAMLASPSPAR